MKKTSIFCTIEEYLKEARGKKLMLTTFSFDEYVTYHFFKQIFDKATWPEKITICCDRMKHKHHGFLQNNIPKSVKIIIKDFTVKRPPRGNNIPVFHSKIWVIKNAKRSNNKYLISSINLSSSHLLEGFKSYENAVIFSAKNNSPVVKEIDKIFKHENEIIAPHFLAIDLRGRSPSLLALNDVKKLIIKSKSRIVTAPFYSKTLLESFDKGMESTEFYQSPSSHAKLILGDNFTISGSANLTCAAWEENNHETIVITNEIKSQSLPKDFNKIEFDNIDDKVDEIGQDDDNGTKWEEEYNKALLGFSAKISDIQEVALAKGKKIKWKVEISIDSKETIECVKWNNKRAEKDKSCYRLTLDCNQIRTLLKTLDDCLSIKFKKNTKLYKFPLDKGNWTKFAYQEETKKTILTSNSKRADQPNGRSSSKGIKATYLDVRKIRDELKGKENLLDIILSTDIPIDEIPPWSYKE